jgi:hypothetical protein
MDALAVAPVAPGGPAIRLLPHPIQTARAARRHRRDPDELPFGVCRACGRPWPCDTARLVVGVAPTTRKTPEGTSVP